MTTAVFRVGTGRGGDEWIGTFAGDGDARVYLGGLPPESRYRLRPFAFDEPTIVLSLVVENTYALSASATTSVLNIEVPRPPQPGTQAHTDWLLEHIVHYSGTDRGTGNAGYDFTIVDCTDEALVGTTFDWGY